MRYPVVQRKAARGGSARAGATPAAPASELAPGSTGHGDVAGDMDAALLGIHIEEHEGVDSEQAGEGAEGVEEAEAVLDAEVEGEEGEAGEPAAQGEEAGGAGQGGVEGEAGAATGEMEAGAEGEQAEDPELPDAEPEGEANAEPEDDDGDLAAEEAEEDTAEEETIEGDEGEGGGEQPAVAADEGGAAAVPAPPAVQAGPEATAGAAPAVGTALAAGTEPGKGVVAERQDLASSEQGNAAEAEGGEAPQQVDAALRRPGQENGAEAEGGEALQQVDAGLVPRGAGQPLDPAMREQLEGETGYALDDVRVHTGGEPAELLAQMGAGGAVKGKDILLPGAQSASPEVVRHEVVHVIQQAEGRADGLVHPQAQGRRAALEGEAHAQPGQAVAERRAGTQRSTAGARQRLGQRPAGAAQFFGIPNPIDVAKKVGKAGISAASSVGKTIVGGARKAVGEVVDVVKGVGRTVVRWVKRQVSRVVGWVRSIARGIKSAFRALGKFADYVASLPIIGAVVAPVLKGLATAADKVGDLYRAAKRRARALFSAARRIGPVLRRIARRGKAYYNAAKAAAAQALRNVGNKAEGIYADVKGAVNAAVKAVAAQARKAYAAAKRRALAIYSGLSKGWKAIVRSAKAAGRWIARHKKGLLSLAHSVLDVAGFLPPPVGPIADLGNALLYAAEGNWAEAAKGIVFAIPAVGDALKAGRYASNGARVARRVRRVGELARTRLRSARTQVRNTGRALERSRAGTRLQIRQFRQKMAESFRPVEQSYRDYKGNIRAFKRRMDERIETFKDRNALKIQLLRDNLAEIQKVYDYYDRAATTYGDVKNTVEDLITGQPAAAPGQAPA